MKAEADVLVDDFARSGKAATSRCHDCAYRISPQNGAGAGESVDRTLMTIVSGSRTIRVVQICGPIERHREEDLVLLAKVEDFIIE
jgi:hypothetical protein